MGSLLSTTSKDVKPSSPSPPDGMAAYILKDLPKDTEYHEFTTTSDMHEALWYRRDDLCYSMTRNQYLVITNVPEDVFYDYAATDIRTDSRQFSRVSAYDPISGTLVCKVRGPADTFLAVRSFEFFLVKNIFDMGLLESLICGPRIVNLGRHFWKEPDGCWMPLSSSQRPQITMVIEAGLMKSANRMAMDARACLETEGSTVQLAVIIQVNRDSPEITVQCWERSAAEVPTQEVKMFRWKEMTIVGGKFVIPFEKAHARPKDPDRLQEQDIIITLDDLKSLAEIVWKEQGFMKR